MGRVNATETTTRASAEGPAMPEERSDGGDVPVGDLTSEEFYRVVRSAVEDAFLGVIGTVLLVGIGFFLFVTGVTATVRVGSAEAPVVAVLGVGLALLGVYVAAAALDYAPSVEDLLFGD